MAVIKTTLFSRMGCQVVTNRSINFQQILLLPSLSKSNMNYEFKNCPKPCAAMTGGSSHIYVVM
jgi:hypothetical protein